MAKQAHQYPVQFGYLEQAYIDGRLYTHRGHDRYTPTGTEVRVGNTIIGLTGATGKVTGPHLHTQAGTDSNAQNTVNPGPYEFQLGTVHRTGTASEWGNYVMVRNFNSGIYVVYAHLSRIDVSAGQVLSSGQMIDWEARAKSEAAAAAEWKARAESESQEAARWRTRAEGEAATAHAKYAEYEERIKQLSQSGSYEIVNEPLYRKK